MTEPFLEAQLPSPRNDEVKIIFSACHRDKGQTALLFQLLSGAGTEIGWAKFARQRRPRILAARCLCRPGSVVL